jgi:hypothetical protein
VTALQPTAQDCYGSLLFCVFTATGALLALGGLFIIGLLMGLLPLLAMRIANTLRCEARLRRWRRETAR